MRRLYRWTISSHATASPAMQRRTRLLTIWASSNQRSRELLAISRRPRCETRHTPRLTSHDYVVVRPKVRSGPASHYEARNCSRAANRGWTRLEAFHFGLSPDSLTLRSATP